jgi:hypothetical protein
MIMSPAAIKENLEMFCTISVLYNSRVTILWIVNISSSVGNFVIFGHNTKGSIDPYELYSEFHAKDSRDSPEALEMMVVVCRSPSMSRFGYANR